MSVNSILVEYLTTHRVESTRNKTDFFASVGQQLDLNPRPSDLNMSVLPTSRKDMLSRIKQVNEALSPTRWQYQSQVYAVVF
jgi:hypothetical protein